MTQFNPLHCWYNLDIDTTRAISPEFEWPVMDKNGRNMIWHYPTPSTIFSQKWLDIAKSVGIEIGAAMMFWRPAGFKNVEAHVDVLNKDPNKSAVAAVNIIVKGRDSAMAWYKKPAGNHEVKWTMAKTPYLTWPIDELEEVERKELGMNLSLVRVDVPHAIFCGNEERWCISARFMTNFPDWETAVKAMHYRGLLVPR